MAVALNAFVGGLAERRKIPDDIIVNAVLNLLNCWTPPSNPVTRCARQMRERMRCAETSTTPASLRRRVLIINDSCVHSYANFCFHFIHCQILSVFIFDEFIFFFFFAFLMKGIPDILKFLHTTYPDCRICHFIRPFLRTKSSLFAWVTRVSMAVMIAPQSFCQTERRSSISHCSGHSQACGHTGWWMSRWWTECRCTPVISAQDLTCRHI